MGFKVDVLVKLLGLHWRPDLGVGEISGGLPRCSLSKEWLDTIKLGLELRDMWSLARDQLNEVDSSSLVMWGFTVVGKAFKFERVIF
jgi:hypothetical protein